MLQRLLAYVPQYTNSPVVLDRTRRFRWP